MGNCLSYGSLIDSWHSLQSSFLEICTKSWDPIIGFLVRRKLDQYKLAALKDSANSTTKVPLLESVLTFLERRSGMLETLDAQTMGHTKTLISRDSNCKIGNMGSHRPLSFNMFRRMDPLTKIAGCANWKEP